MSDCQVCDAPCEGANLCRTHTRALTHLLEQIPDSTETDCRDHRDAHGNPVYRELRDRLGAPIPYTTSHDPITADKTIPGLASDLETTATRQDRLGVTSETRTTSEKPLVWNDRASIVAVDLNTTLNAWALDVARHHQDPRDPLQPVDHADTGAVAEWLARNIHTLTQLADAGQAHNEIVDAHHRALAAIDYPNIRTKFLVGPCPELLGDQHDEPCPGEVWAFIPTSEHEPAWLRCQNEDCGAGWNTTQWNRVGDRIQRRKRQLDRQHRASGAA